MIEQLIITSLAGFSLGYLVTMTSGPFNVFKALRRKIARTRVLECTVCSSVWGVGLSALVYIFAPYGHVIVTGLAAVGLAILVIEVIGILDR